MSRNFFGSTYSGKNSQGNNPYNLKIRRTRRADGIHYVIPRVTATTPATMARDMRTTKPLTNWRPMQHLSDFIHMRLKSRGSRLGRRWIKQGWMQDNKFFSLSGRVLENLVLLVKWLLHRLHTGLVNQRMRCWKEAGMLPVAKRGTTVLFGWRNESPKIRTAFKGTKALLGSERKSSPLSRGNGRS